MYSHTYPILYAISSQTYPGGYALGTASADSTCRLYDIRSDRELGLYDAGNGCAATSMAFSRQGRYLFTGELGKKDCFVLLGVRVCFVAASLARLHESQYHRCTR